jgi:glycosyltransferase involved in cell wall biosynthesis
LTTSRRDSHEDGRGAPLTVTIVAHHVGSIGGMERQLAELIGGLLDRGHRVSLIARRCELPPHPDLNFVKVGGPSRPFTIAFPWFLVVASVKAWRHRGAILHTTGALVLNRSDVVSVHFCNEAVRDRPRLLRARKRSRLYRLNARIAIWMGRGLERFIYRPARASVLVSVSAGVERELARHFPYMRKRLRTIPNAVDSREFRPDAQARAETRSELGLREDRLVALFVAAEWEGKGLAHAIEGVAARPRWSLLVVGPGDRVRFEALAERLGAQDRVRFVGPARDIARYYQAADAFVLPTGYEAFPLAVLEAAASGLPLLVTAVNGVEEILVEEVNGWFIETGGASVSRRLADLESSRSRRLAMGAAAREAATRFRWSDVVDGYERLYFELVGGAPPPMAQSAVLDPARSDL